MQEIVNEVIASYGDIKAVQERFNYTSPEAVYNWRSRGIPKDKIADIHLDTGISIRRLQGEIQEAA